MLSHIEQSQIADTLKELLATNGWAVFKKEVLDTLFLSAFDSFQQADAEKPLRVIKIQQEAVAISNIEKRIEALIREGDLAREILIKLTDEENYE